VVGGDAFRIEGCWEWSFC